MAAYVPDGLANFARYYWSYKSAVADVAIGWVGQNMNWIAFDSNTTTQSTLYKFLTSKTAKYVPSAGSTMCCWEMPLMAALSHNAISKAKALRVYTNPDYYLSAGYLKSATTASPQKGDLVTWVNEASDDSILGRAFKNFGKSTSTAPTKLGLAHVTLATGAKASDGSAEVISFWGNYRTGDATGPIERTSVKILSTSAQLTGCKVVFGPPAW